MKRREFLTMLSAAFLTAGVFGSETSSKKGGKMLVVYYSWSGNTKKVAEFIAKHTGADVLELENPNPRLVELWDNLRRFAELVGDYIVAD